MPEHQIDFSQAKILELGRLLTWFWIKMGVPPVRFTLPLPAPPPPLPPLPLLIPGQGRFQEGLMQGMIIWALLQAQGPQGPHHRTSHTIIYLPQSPQGPLMTCA